MEQIKPRKPKQIDLFQAAVRMANGEEPFVLYPDEESGKYARQTLEEFIEDCMFFITEEDKTA